VASSGGILKLSILSFPFLPPRLSLEGVVYKRLCPGAILPFLLFLKKMQTTALFAALLSVLLAYFYSTSSESVREILASLVSPSSGINTKNLASSVATGATTTTTISSLVNKSTPTATSSSSEEDTIFTPIVLAEEMIVARTIAKAFKAIEKAEGAGAKVRRSVGTSQLKNFSPFLMLDHFSVGPEAGFPDHPHRYARKKTTSHPFVSL